MERRTAETLKGLRVATMTVDPSGSRDLSGGQRQSVAVARAAMWNSKLVVLDERRPRSASPRPSRCLELVRRLGRTGLTVVLISRDLHEIFETATRFTVLRLGRNISIYERTTTTQEEVIQAITAGIPTKVAGITETDPGWWHELGRGRHSTPIGLPGGHRTETPRHLAAGARRGLRRATSACSRSYSRRS